MKEKKYVRKKEKAFPSKFSICPQGMPFEEEPQARSSSA